MSGRLLHIKNNTGNLFFTPDAILKSNSNKIDINCENEIKITSNKIINLEGNLTQLNSNSVQLYSYDNDDEKAIFIKNEEKDGKTLGGITVISGEKGHNIHSFGNINLNSKSGTINIGKSQLDFELLDSSENTLENTEVENLTQNIIIESLKKISLNTEDFYTIASDSIHFISQSGEINFGSNVGESFLKIDDNLLLINKQTNYTDDNYTVDIDIKNNEENLRQVNNDGIRVNSLQPELNSQILLNNNIDENINLGITSSNSINHSSFFGNPFNAYHKDQYLLSSHLALNKSIYFTESKQHVLLMDKPFYCLTDLNHHSNFEIKAELNSTEIVSSSSSSPTSYQYKIFIVNNNQFKWCKYDYNTSISYVSDDIIDIKKDNKINIDHGTISITFPVINGYSESDYWMFNVIFKTKTNVNLKLPKQSCRYVNNNISYLSTNSADLKLETNNYQRINIGSQGGISIGSNAAIPYTTKIDSNLESVNNISNNALSYHTIPLKREGGYLCCYESMNGNNLNSNLYLDTYLEEGEKNLLYPTIKVNSINSGFNSNPYITYLNSDINVSDGSIRNTNNKYDFIIVWSRKEKDNAIYSLFCNIFSNGKKKKSFDIPLATTYNNEELLSLKATQISNSTVLITWSGEDKNINNFSIFGLLIDKGGNIIKERFVLSEISNNSYYNPQIMLLNKKNNEVIVFYEEKYETLYKLKYKVIDFNKNLKINQEKYLLSSIGPTKIIKINNNYLVSLYDNLSTQNHKLVRNIIDSNKTQDYYLSILDSQKYKINKIENNIIYINDTSPFSENQLVDIYLNEKLIAKTAITLVNKDNLITTATKNSYLASYKLSYKLELNDFYLHNSKYNLINQTNEILSINKPPLIFGLENESLLAIISHCDNSIENIDILNYNFNFLNNNTLLTSYYDIESINIMDIQSSSVLTYIENNELKMKHIQFKDETINMCDNIKYYKNRGHIMFGISNESNSWNTSRFHLEGSYSSSIKTIKSDYKLTNQDNTILADTSNQNIIISIDNDHRYYGRYYTIKLISDKNKVIIKSSNNNSYIDGQKELSLDKIYQKITIQSDGFNWYIL